MPKKEKQGVVVSNKTDKTIVVAVKEYAPHPKYKKIIETTKHYKARIITFGSGAMYGKDRNLHKVKEDEIGSYIPKDLYGISKLEMSKIVTSRNDILMLNIFACYGYGELESRFPSYAINCVLENKPIIINQNVIFDYLWVEDMQRIVNYFIKNKPVSNIINITPTESISLYEIAEIVNSYAENKVQIEIKNPIMNNEYTGDNSRLIKEIGHFEFTSMQDGLKKLYNYKQN